MRPTKTVSFSGIDGAGKSTQIERLKSRCEEHGLSVRVVVFWDQVARLKQLREHAGHSIFKGDKGVGTPSHPIRRRDKNVRSFPMTLVRLFLYLVDGFSTRATARAALRSGVDLVIFDRTIDDELVNLRLSHPLIRLYARLILWIVPRPDIRYILDADPSAAFARKPEYPLDFLIAHRQSYLRWSEMIHGIVLVPALEKDEVADIVASKALELFQSCRTEDKPLADRTRVESTELDALPTRIAEL